MFQRIFSFPVLLGAGVLLLSSIALPTHAAEAFQYTFSVDGSLNEAGSVTQTTSPYWWVNSGGMLGLAGGMGQTIQGSLSATNRWRLAYSAANPVDTDNGYHPQNLFRLVTKDSWQNASVVSKFNIVRDNLSASSNRNASNGLLLMNRYALDGQTLYYAGIRVDGTAVIKKKYHGTYYTMAQEQVFPGSYNTKSAPNLMPHGEWLTLKSDVVTKANGSVRVDLYIRRGDESTWTLLLSAVDDGKKYGDTPIIADGFAGIRTDFMDVKFDTFRVNTL